MRSLLGLARLATLNFAELYMKSPMPVPMPQHIHAALQNISLSSKAYVRKLNVFGPAGIGFSRLNTS